jgi:hypothetical protein
MRKCDVARNEERLEPWRRQRNVRGNRNNRHRYDGGIGVALLQHRDEAVVRRRVVARVEPVVQVWACATERRNHQKGNQSNGEKQPDRNSLE